MCVSAYIYRVYNIYVYICRKSTCSNHHHSGVLLGFPAAQHSLDGRSSTTFPILCWQVATRRYRRFLYLLCGQGDSDSNTKSGVGLGSWDDASFCPDTTASDNAATSNMLLSPLVHSALPVCSQPCVCLLPAERCWYLTRVLLAYCAWVCKHRRWILEWYGAHI